MAMWKMKLLFYERCEALLHCFVLCFKLQWSQCFLSLISLTLSSFHPSSLCHSLSPSLFFSPFLLLSHPSISLFPSVTSLPLPLFLFFLLINAFTSSLPFPVVNRQSNSYYEQFTMACATKGEVKFETGNGINKLVSNRSKFFVN